MTVLDDYIRLEAQGLWRPSPEAQRRDVVISLGEATLTLTDAADRPLTHWSLPAVERLNPGETPALYAPGRDAGETLEVTDREMVAAIERVRRAIRRPAGRRLRRGVVLSVLAAVGLIAVIWLPGALSRYAASILPPEARTVMGDALMDHVVRLTGAPCTGADGTAALEALATRLFPDAPPVLKVMPGGVRSTLTLPGGQVLIARELVEDHETPDVVAGYLLAEAARRGGRDPALRLLDGAGPLAAVTLLTTGRVEDRALAAHAERLVGTRPATVPADRLRPGFAAAGVPVTPYAEALALSGRPDPALLAPGDETTARPVLPDDDWVALQEICEGG